MMVVVSPHSLEAVPWDEWVAEVVSVVDSCLEDHGHHVVVQLVAPMCSTELETGSVPTRDVETKILLGEQSVTSARHLNLKASFLLHSHPKVVNEEEEAQV